MSGSGAGHTAAPDPHTSTRATPCPKPPNPPTGPASVAAGPPRACRGSGSSRRSWSSSRFATSRRAPATWYAFTDWDGISRSANWVGLDNFREILDDPASRGALENTVTLAFTFVITANVIGLCIALALHRTLKTRGLLRAVFFVPVVMSSLAVSYVWQFIFSFTGPLNRFLGAVGLESFQRAWTGDPTWALWTIFVVLVWQFVGLSMVMYLAGLEGIPEELDEASAVDGASTFRRFRKITLPLLAPAITVSVTLSTIYGLGVFDQVLAVTGGWPGGRLRDARDPDLQADLRVRPFRLRNGACHSS